jgi:hypothetical protein
MQDGQDHAAWTLTSRKTMEMDSDMDMDMDMSMDKTCTYVDYYIIGPALNGLTLLSEGATAELAEVSVS